MRGGREKGGGGTAAIVAAALSLGLAYFLSGVCKLQSFFQLPPPRQSHSRRGGSRAGVGVVGSTLRSRCSPTQYVSVYFMPLTISLKFYACVWGPSR